MKKVFKNELGSKQETDGLHDGLNQLRRLCKDANFWNIVLVQRVQSLQFHRLHSWCARTSAKLCAIVVVVVVCLFVCCCCYCRPGRRVLESDL